MNAGRKIILGLFFAALTFAAAGAEPKESKAPNDAKATKGTKVVASTPPLSPRFKQVREKINTLFEHRNEPPPPPDPRANPFRPPGAVVVATAPTTPAGDTSAPVAVDPEPPSTDLTKLQECLATLKFGGTLERGGHLYLMINGKPYKENEVIQVQVQAETVYLRVRQISRRGVTIGLNEAEMTWNTGAANK